MLAICRWLINQSKRMLLAPHAIACCAYATYQLLMAHLSEWHRDWTDEMLANELLRILGVVHSRNLDIHQFLGEPCRMHGLYRPETGPSTDLFLNHAAFSLFPRMPQADRIDRIVTSKLIQDCYAARHYVDIFGAMRLYDGIRVPLRAKIPSAAMAQLRLIHLFSKAKWDDLITAVAMHSWETLGRSILHACGGSKTVTEATNFIIHNEGKPSTAIPRKTPKRRKSQ